MGRATVAIVCTADKLHGSHRTGVCSYTHVLLLMLSSSVQVHVWAEACMPPTTEQQKSVIEMYGQYIVYTMHAAVSGPRPSHAPTPKMKWKAALHADCDLHRNWVNCFLNLPLSLRVKPHVLYILGQEHNYTGIWIASPHLPNHAVFACYNTIICWWSAWWASKFMRPRKASELTFALFLQLLVSKQCIHIVYAENRVFGHRFLKL